MQADPAESQLASAEPFKRSKQLSLTVELPGSLGQYDQTRSALILGLNLADAISQSKSVLSAADLSKLVSLCKINHVCVC